MIPEGLKIGDTFTEASVDNKVFKSKVVGFDGQGRYIAEFLGMVPKDKAPLEEDPLSLVEEVTPIEAMITAAEEPQKPVAKKPATRKRKTTTKKK